jgi:DNA-binding transcriptional ArsR family regulator
MNSNSTERGANIMSELSGTRSAKVTDVIKGMPESDLLGSLTELFRIFADLTRVRILFSLFESDLCVSDIADVLGMEQSAVSHQLSILKNAKLIGSKREGKENVYFLLDSHVRSIIDQGFEHISEGKDVLGK